ncbi:DUF5123 domain-containing protein [Flavobacterium eburneipallidum]|uniref:DUF5123 domain-containing protein n=1 Tax=Flavobacterium eburneipallidum TaxID=3003263 RepID=UPI0022AC75A3|nr:DUF5123 domain-containing protein [Flavobacterium eburneipallidum]
MKNINIFKTLLLLVGVLFLYSCSQETFPETRLFRPVLNKDLSSINNTIIVDMGKMKSAVYYKIEISRDTFKTILKSVDTPQNKYVFDGLLWNTLYQVRATAIAETPEFDSRISDFGGVKTVVFPSNLQPVTDADLIDTAVKVRWNFDASQTVTEIKVFEGADEFLLTPIASHPVSSAEDLAGVKIINGLTPGTKYQIAIFSNGVIKGWNLYATKPAIPLDPNSIDLRNTNDPTILIPTMIAAAPGSTIILDGNFTYNATGYAFDKSLKIVSGLSFNPAGATINVTKEFSFVTGSNVDSVIFDGVTLTGTTGGYLFNQSTDVTIGTLKFNNSRINTFRGIARFRSGMKGTLGNYEFNNCIVSNILDYTCFANESATFNYLNVLVTNSTFYKIRRFLTNRSTANTESIIVKDCTFSEVVGVGANYFFDFTANVTNGVSFTNVILGRAWDFANANAGYDSYFTKAGQLATTNFTFQNTHQTSDAVYLVPTPSPINFKYTKTITDLWKDPLQGDFNFKDSGFQGVKTAGDPRWRLK